MEKSTKHHMREDGPTCRVMIHLIYALIVYLKFPLVCSRNLDPREVKHVTGGSCSRQHCFFVRCPLPVRCGRTRIYAPRLELFLCGHICAGSFRTHTHYV